MDRYVEIWKGLDDGWYFHVKAGNHQVVEEAGESYVDKFGAERAAKAAHPGLKVIDKRTGEEL